MLTDKGELRAAEGQGGDSEADATGFAVKRLA